MNWREIRLEVEEGRKDEMKENGIERQVKEGIRKERIGMEGRKEKGEK